VNFALPTVQHVLKVQQPTAHTVQGVFPVCIHQTVFVLGKAILWDQAVLCNAILTARPVQTRASLHV
jgi:hypothetical protein